MASKTLALFRSTIRSSPDGPSANSIKPVKSDRTAMSRYSIVSLARHALRGHVDWPRAWRDPPPKSTYDVIVVGGGGHGLATAYYSPRITGSRRWLSSKRAGSAGATRAQHNDRALELPVEGECAILRAFAEALGRLVARAQLQRHVLAAWVLNLAHSDAQMDATQGVAMRCV